MKSRFNLQHQIVFRGSICRFYCFTLLCESWCQPPEHRICIDIGIGIGIGIGLPLCWHWAGYGP